MSAMFSNIFVIIVLQVSVILFSFFLPEILFRITKKQVAWHVLLASFFMIFSVIFLTLLYSSSIRLPEQTSIRPVQASPAPVAAPEYTLRIGPLPQQTGKPVNLQLSLFNNGPANDFICFLGFLDKASGKPLDSADFELTDQKNRLHLETGGMGVCSWDVTFHRTGAVLADAYVQGKNMEPSNHEQVVLDIASELQSVRQPAMQAAEKVAVSPSFMPEANPAPSSEVDAASGPAPSPDAEESTAGLSAEHKDTVVWVYYTRDEATDAVLVNELKAHGYAYAEAKGKWKTRSESQFLFHRKPEDKGAAALRDVLKLDEMEEYYYDEHRVGKKIKQTFEDNPSLNYLVIAR